MTASDIIPRFAIVGHPNKGKSSIVATLSQDESVAISPNSGTTASNRDYPMKVDGRELYRLIDTPGFQRARLAMDWMQKKAHSVADRANVVAQFVSEHSNDPRFEAESELLRPIIAGAGILYVVDGSLPYSAEYDAEMEILRWTGQPSMALINQIGKLDYVADWRQALAQYFRIVREFNAQTADYEKQTQLLSGFSELNEQWHRPLTEAVAALTLQQHNRRRQSGRLIANMIATMLFETMLTSCPADSGSDLSEDRKTQLDQRYYRHLVSIENKCRKEIERLYNYNRLQRSDTALPAVSADLFSEESWQMFGLTNDQLLVSGAIGGAATGGIIDIASGGTSLLLGTGVGAVIGGLSAWFGSERLANTRIKGFRLGKKTLLTGPIKNINFPYVVLDRALLHHQLVEQRTHAQQGVLNTASDVSVSKQLESTQRKDLDKLFSRIRKSRRPQSELINNLTENIYQIITRLT